MTAERKKGLLFASAGSIFWGSSGIAGQFLLINENIAPEWLTFFRLFCAGFLLLLLAHFLKGNIFSIWQDRKDRTTLLIFSIFGMLGTQYGYFASIRCSNAPTATILEYLMPILIIFWYCLTEKRWPRMMEIFCALFAITGTALIATGGDFRSLSISGKALFWGLLSALACALYTVEPVGIIKKYGAPLVVGWGMFLASFVLLPVVALTPFTGTVDMPVLLAFTYVVIFGTICSFVLYLGSVAYILPTEASIISAIEPLSSIIFSFLIFHLTFSFWELMGMALIILAVAVVARK